MPDFAVPVLLIVPFILLLGMIATGPVLYEHFWDRYYAVVSIFLASLVVVYYLFVLNDRLRPLEALIDYIQFISLIGALYTIAGGILINVETQATPFTNVVLLWMGAFLANIIGTTGASMLLIRPFIRINKPYVKAYHMVFFIFIVSNVGGGLTPVGDPPLFLGFLNGVPFFWTTWHCFLPWLFTILPLTVMFYIIDQHHQSYKPALLRLAKKKPSTLKIKINGKQNFFFLMAIGVAVFIDPAIFKQVPGLNIHGHTYSYVRELIFISSALLAYVLADRHVLKRNSFTFAPLKEVMCIFMGIFGTMIPVLALINQFAISEIGQNLTDPRKVFWGAGSFSMIVDNVPTYVAALKASTAARGETVLLFSKNAIKSLKAISISTVFFGAMTYIGNGPNYMVKKIAEQHKVEMPSFFGYIRRFAIPYLLPVLVLIWLVFFVCN